jgi:hypothetical protein
MSCAVITRSGYVLLFWWLIQCHYFTSGVFSRPAFLNCFSWVGHQVLIIRTLLKMYMIWTVYNYKIAPLEWRKDMFLPWQVLDTMFCGTQHALVLIHRSRQSAVCYEKCYLWEDSFVHFKLWPSKCSCRYWLKNGAVFSTILSFRWESWC